MGLQPIEILVSPHCFQRSHVKFEKGFPMCFFYEQIITLLEPTIMDNNEWEYILYSCDTDNYIIIYYNMYLYSIVVANTHHGMYRIDLATTFIYASLVDMRRYYCYLVGPNLYSLWWWTSGQMTVEKLETAKVIGLSDLSWGYPFFRGWFGCKIPQKWKGYFH